jgi:hypothetical protein
MAIFNDTQNKEIVNNVIDVLKLNPITDAIPRQVIPTIQPVFAVEPQISTFLLSSAGTDDFSLATTSSTRDTYITGAVLSVAKVATDTLATVNLTVTPENSSETVLIGYRGVTLTADSQTISVSLPYPLKLKRNTLIRVDFNVANGASTASIWGFTRDGGNNLSV